MKDLRMAVLMVVLKAETMVDKMVDVLVDCWGASMGVQRDTR
jgi:hypothetical protein